MTCARRWSTSWASLPNWRRCARISSTRSNTLTAELAALKAQAAEATEAEPTTEIDRLGEDFDEAIRFIKTSIGNMDRLINAVLKLSREGRRQFSPEQVDMKAMLEAVVENVAHRAAEQGAELTVGDLPPVESDRLALEQIFANLIDNALKYGRPEEPLRIDIAGRINGPQVTYDVQDNGRGIDPHDHQRVFELFRRSGRAGSPGRRHRSCPCPGAGAPPWRQHGIEVRNSAKAARSP